MACGAFMIATLQASASPCWTLTVLATARSASVCQTVTRALESPDTRYLPPASQASAYTWSFNPGDWSFSDQLPTFHRLIRIFCGVLWLSLLEASHLFCG